MKFIILLIICFNQSWGYEDSDDDNLRSIQLREYLEKHPLTRIQLMSRPYQTQHTREYMQQTLFPLLQRKHSSLNSDESVIDSVRKDTPYPIRPISQEQKKSSSQEHLPTSNTEKQMFTIPVPEEKSYKDVYFVAIVSGCSAVAIFGVIGAGLWVCKIQNNKNAAAEVDYPAYGVTGPNKDSTSPNGDRKLAQSAQMYHYQHQKQQMIAVEKASSARQTSASDADSEEENEEGDYTVYECPGLASTVEMEVKNPLFQDDTTPMSPPTVTEK